jgi:hypothetical protein
MTQVAKRDWKKIVEESNGTSVFTPDSLKGRVEEWAAKRTEFNKKINEVAELEVNLSVFFQNLILDIRKHYAQAGMNEIWSKDVGVDMNALADGEFIFNITEGRK